MRHHAHIDGLRAIAVVPVILFHYRPEWAPGGYTGVDIFFVISGFLITGVLRNLIDTDRHWLWRFYERRARRILPALIAMCVFSSLAAWAMFLPEDLEAFGNSLIGVALFASNVTFYQDVGYFAAPAHTKPLLHTWSLAVEEQFYLLYPLLMYAGLRLLRLTPPRQALGLGGLCLVSVILSAVLTPRTPEAAFYLLHSRAFELLIGSLTFYAATAWKGSSAMAEGAGLAGAGLIAFAFIAFNHTTQFPGLAALVPCLGTALLLWSGLDQPTWTGRVLSLLPMAAIGKVSYGLYLYHWPILVFARYWVERPLSGMETVLAFAATGAAAAASYFWLEKPLRIRRLVPDTRKLFVLSGGALAGLAALGLLAMAADGFPARFDSRVLAYLKDDPAPRQDCLKAERRDAGRLTECQIGALKKEPPDLVLWGDSHANSLAPGLARFAEAEGMSGWSIWSPGCPPLLGIERPEAPKFQCAAVNQRALAAILNLRPRIVILAARWDSVLPPEADSIEDNRVASGTPRMVLNAAGGVSLTGLDAFAAGLKATMDALSKAGLRVVLVKQVPPHRLKLATALAKKEWLGRDPNTLNRVWSAVEGRRAPLNRLLEQAGGGALILDPADMLCPGKTACLASRAGRSLYLDNTHLSVFGSFYVQGLWQSLR